MHSAKLLICIFLLVASFSSLSFELTALSKILFKDTAIGIQDQLQDAKFEYDAYAVLLQDAELHEHSHILVARNKNVVLIVGQASSGILRDKVEKLVLTAAHIKRTGAAVNHVAPVNTQICGKAARNSTANDKRKFILKAADDCSSVNRFYNEVIISPPANEVQKSDSALLKAIVVNKLLRSSIVDRVDSIKVIVTDGRVYLLGGQLSKQAAERVTEFVMNLDGVKKVVPLFSF